MLTVLVALAALPVMLFTGSGCTADDTRGESVDTVAPSAPPSRQPVNCGQLYRQASAMDSVLLAALETSDTVAMKAIDTFTTFAYYCDDDSLSPVYLIKTAQVARAVGKPAHAKVALENCINTYRSFPDRPAAIFLLGQLYEDNTFMQNRDEAERAYRQVTDEYPRTIWAENARAALAMLGKSDEEIIRMLKQKK